MYATAAVFLVFALVDHTFASEIPPPIRRRLLAFIEWIVVDRILVAYSAVVGAVFAVYSTLIAGLAVGIGSFLALTREVVNRLEKHRWATAFAIAGAATCMAIEVLLVMQTIIGEVH
jgi:hypothetical protein